jgi:molybdopterin-guanine dinucleotide biosynthesis protein A
MIGIVLSGGQSTRMGTDKGLLLKDQLTWAQLAYDKLKRLGIDVFISVHSEQSAAYSKLFSRLLIDEESLSVKGPLHGLLTAHSSFPDQDLLILACDMLDVSSELLQEFVKTQFSNAHEASVFVVDGKPQPLCGIYSAKGLRKIFDLYRQGLLKKFSMMHVLDLLDTNYITADAGQWSYFNNYNSPDDLQQQKD